MNEKSFAQEIEQMLRDVTKQHPYLIHNISNWDFMGIYQDYADRFGANANELTKMEKGQAFMNHIFEKYAPESETE